MLSTGIEYIVENIAGQLQRQVIVPFLPQTELFPDSQFIVPQRGEKRDILEFSLRTARLYRAELLKNMEIKNPERHTERLMEAMKRELRLDKEPRHRR